MIIQFSISGPHATVARHIFNIFCSGKCKKDTHDAWTRDKKLRRIRIAGVRLAAEYQDRSGARR